MESVISFFDIANCIKKELGSSSRIVTTKRVGSMPHDGYRAFDNKKINALYKNFSFKSFEKGVSHFTK